MIQSPETARRQALEAAEAKALLMFDAIERAALIAPGRSEREIEQDILALAEREFGVEKHWHKRIVRAGVNSLTVAGDNPPDRTIAEDDIVYLDLGPVFEEWEADIGKTYVLGNDARKQALIAELPRQFEKMQAHASAHPDITGADLYAFAQASAREAGWTFGGVIAGHIVSEFAHMLIPGDKDLNRIGPRNPEPMRNPDTLGRARHWILEIHLVDPERGIGGFYERLL